MVGQLIARYGRCPEFGGIANGVFELQVCVMDEQKIVDEIIKACGNTNSAAKVLYKLYLRGPCLKGD